MRYNTGITWSTIETKDLAESEEKHYDTIELVSRG